jgi:hypothetical protein
MVVAARLVLSSLLVTMLGSSATNRCAQCHTNQATHFAATPMAQALLTPSETKLPKPLRFRDGAYEYLLSHVQGVLTYRVSAGEQTLTVPVLWSFGKGVAGQTYVYRHDGNLYESRVSYYPRIEGLDLTLGAQGSKPDSLELAAGRKMNSADISECFGCHSTGGGFGTRFSLEAITAGVQCGACHEGSDNHEAAMLSGKGVMPRSLKKLGAEEMNELCGRCHRTWEQIAISGPRGVANVRFQPYRITLSKCFDAADHRIACTACHDPHGPLQTNAEAYDGSCRSCHTSEQACPVAASKCTECHMPEYEIPGSHMIFNDHNIRVVRNKKDYPD